MLSKAQKALRNCEERLRSLVAEAAAAGQYDVVNTITEWARTVGSLAESSGCQHTVEAESENQLKVTEVVVADVLMRRPKSKENSAYPRFARSRTELVKIGWSKKEKKEYLHRAPWPVLELLCQQLNTRGSDEFTSDDVLPLLEGDGVEVPSYQSYLCLAWLRDSGLIIKDGRQGYLVPQGVDLLEEAAKAWKDLPHKR